MSEKTRKRKIIVSISALAGIVAIVVVIGSLCRVRFLNKPTTGYILKEEDGSVQAFIYTHVINGSFKEQTIRFNVGGGTEYQDGYLKSENYYGVQVEIQDASPQVSVNGDCITIPRGEKVFLLITAQNEYIGNKYEGEQVYLRREAPEDVSFVVVSGGGTGSQTETGNMPEQTEEDENTERRQKENARGEDTEGQNRDGLNSESNNWEEHSGYYYLSGERKQEFVESFLGEGAYGQEPYASYISPDGELHMDLWYDEDSECWCGIRSGSTKFDQEVEEVCGFVIDKKGCMEETKGWNLNPIDQVFSTNDFMASGLSYSVSDLKNLQGSYAYDETGRVSSYQVTGDFTQGDETYESEYLYSINYTYYENGMTEKAYSHRISFFGTSGHFQPVIYDENDREIYSLDYVSGAVWMEDYYFYKDDSAVPFCCLTIDGGTGATEPAILSFCNEK